MKTRTRDAAETAAVTGFLSAAVVVPVLLLVAVGLGAWAFSVWFSGTKGAGDLHKDQNSAANREFWSARFNEDMQAIQADQTNLSTLHHAMTEPGATQKDRTDYYGAQLNCRTDVAAYNADAANVLAAPWIPAGFPTSIDANDYCGK